jgi:hypothetical protein
VTRRDAAWAIARAAAVASGGEFFGEWMRAAETHSHSSFAPPEPDRWTNYQPKFFSAPEFKTLDTFTAILIPSDETPGAREAHVAPFIDFVVNAAAEYAPPMQAQWRDAMGWLGANKFSELPEKEQVALVEAMAAPERDRAAQHPGFATYRLIKEMTVRAYYTSRAGLVDELDYKGFAYLKEFPACNHPEHRKV